MTSLCLSKVTDAVRSLNNATTANVRFREDNHIPCISGCAFLPDGQLVLCDFANTVFDLFSALCAKLFQNGGKFLKYFFSFKRTF